MRTSTNRHTTIGIIILSTLFCTASIGSVVYGFSLTATASSQQSSEHTITRIDTIPNTAGIPIHIAIPAIGVHAAIEEVGLTALGAMDVPKDPNTTGWYSPGTRPGNIGSAVIAGHVNSPTSANTVFTDLSSISVGDVITITGSDDVSRSFIVRLKKMYAADDDAEDIFTSHDGASHLNLITCAGNWDSALRSYTERLIVFADLQ